MKINKKFYYLFLGLFLSFVLCGSLFYMGTNFSDSDQEQRPFVIESHGLYAFRTNEKLVEDADLVIIGTVKKIEPAQWGTPNGKMPKGVTIVKGKDKSIESVTIDIEPDDAVHTDVIFEVSEVYKGQTISKEIRVRTMGGIVDGLQFKDREGENAEDYIIGKEYMLFLMKGMKDDKWTDEFYFTLTPQAKILLTDSGSGIDAEGESSDVKELKKLLEENPNKESVR